MLSALLMIKTNLLLVVSSSLWQVLPTHLKSTSPLTKMIPHFITLNSINNQIKLWYRLNHQRCRTAFLTNRVQSINSLFLIKAIEVQKIISNQYRQLSSRSWVIEAPSKNSSLRCLLINRSSKRNYRTQILGPSKPNNRHKLSNNKIKNLFTTTNLIGLKYLFI